MFAALLPGMSALARSANRHLHAPPSLMTSTHTCPTAAQYGASASKPPVSLSDHAMRSASSVGL